MYTEILTQIRNAQAAGKESVKLPFSNMNLAILELLSKRGFVGAVEKKGRMPKRVIDVALNYDENGNGSIQGVRFVSKPSRRLYVGYKDMKSVRQGYGMAVVSTSKGIMNEQQARKEKVGGQMLFEIW
ncbi:MAG: 30S ribosomal protein S8 [Candidatus Paceibacterota bacterium]